MRNLFIIMGLFFTLYGCSNNNQSVETTNGEELQQQEQDSLGLEFDIKTENNKAVFTIILENSSNETKKLEFPSSQKYEIIVLNQDQQEVFRYSEGKMFAQAIEYVLIKPGESMQWEEEWNYKEAGIEQGTFEAELTIPARNIELGQIKKSFQIPE